MPDDDEILPEQTTPDDWWVDPLVVIETLTNSMYCIADSDIAPEELKKINADFTATLYQAHKLLRIKLKLQIKDFDKTEKDG